MAVKEEYNKMQVGLPYDLYPNMNSFYENVKSKSHGFLKNNSLKIFLANTDMFKHPAAPRWMEEFNQPIGLDC